MLEIFKWWCVTFCWSNNNLWAMLLRIKITEEEPEDIFKKIQSHRIANKQKTSLVSVVKINLFFWGPFVINIQISSDGNQRFQRLLFTVFFLFPVRDPQHSHKSRFQVILISYIYLINLSDFDMGFKLRWNTGVKFLKELKTLIGSEKKSHILFNS